MAKFWSTLFSKSSKKSAESRNLKLEDRPPENSLRDPVTKLYNRKYLIQRLEAAMSRASRNNERMAVVLWDIDGFVAFNNRYGQAEGDRFLKSVAETIRRTLRSTDEAFRAGGDEFCAILIPADENITFEVTRRVQQAVSKDLFEEKPDYANQKFSISAGVVFSPGESRVPEALLHEAGQVLYKNRLKGVAN